MFGGPDLATPRQHKRFPLWQTLALMIALVAVGLSYEPEMRPPADPSRSAASEHPNPPRNPAVAAQPTRHAGWASGTVTRIVDGDTLHASFSGTAREYCHFSRNHYGTC